MVSASTTALQKLQPLDTASAAGYRGRCHTPTPYYHGDPGSCPFPDQTSSPTDNCSNCESTDSPGMPTWFLSEPYANFWVYDTPLTYKPAYGPTLPFKLAYNANRTAG